MSSTLFAASPRSSDASRASEQRLPPVLGALGAVVSAGLGFVTLRLLAAIFSPSEFAAWTLMMSVSGLVVLVGDGGAGVSYARRSVGLGPVEQAALTASLRRATDFGILVVIVAAIPFALAAQALSGGLLSPILFAISVIHGSATLAVAQELLMLSVRMMRRQWLAVLLTRSVTVAAVTLVSALMSEGSSATIVPVVGCLACLGVAMRRWGSDTPREHVGSGHVVELLKDGFVINAGQLIGTGSVVLLPWLINAALGAPLTSQFRQLLLLSGGATAALGVVFTAMVFPLVAQGGVSMRRGEAEAISLLGLCATGLATVSAIGALHSMVGLTDQAYFGTWRLLIAAEVLRLGAWFPGYVLVAAGRLGWFAVTQLFGAMALVVGMTAYLPRRPTLETAAHAMLVANLALVVASLVAIRLTKHHPSSSWMPVALPLVCGLALGMLRDPGLVSRLISGVLVAGVSAACAWPKTAFEQGDRLGKENRSCTY